MKFKIKITEEETFEFPLPVLEQLARNDYDIIVVMGEQQMWLHAIDYYVFRESEDEDDSFYKICKFKFKADNSKKLSDYQIMLTKKFHYSWLNHKPLWDYLNSPAFFDLLKQIGQLRTNNVILPEQNDVFKLFLLPKDTVQLPKSLTTMNGNMMNDFWYELLNLC